MSDTPPTDKITESEADTDILQTESHDGANEPPVDPSILNYPEPTQSTPSPEKATDDSDELEINMAIEYIRGEDEIQKQHGCTKLRQIIYKITTSKNYPEVSNTLIHSGIIDRCIEFLEKEQSPDLQIEAAWILRQIAQASSDDTKTMVEAGVVEPLVNLLKSSNSKVADQCVWTLGSIAGAGAEMRDHLISKGIVPPLIALAETQTNITFLETTAWAISNICRFAYGAPAVPETYPCLPVLIRMAQQGCGELELLYYVINGLMFLTQNRNEDLITQIVTSGIVPQLVQTLTHHGNRVIVPCLRVLGNLVCSNFNSNIEEVLEAGILPFLGTLIQNPNFEEETTWIVSNIACGTMAQRSALITAGILPRVIEVLGSERIASQKLATHTVLNIINGRSVDQIRSLIHIGVIPPMIRLLDSGQSEIIMDVVCALLRGLEILRVNGEQDLIIKLIEESGGFSKLTQLQSHENLIIANRTALILESVLSNDEEDGGDENHANHDDNFDDFDWEEDQGTMSRLIKILVKERINQI